jgi:hypothetical protein
LTPAHGNAMLDNARSSSSNREMPQMRRRFATLAVLTPLFALAADPPADKAKDKNQPPLRVGANVPGPFHPYNVTGRYGPRKEKDKDEESEGRFHCPVTEHAEDPMVLVFTRDVELGDKTKSLLQKLDNVTAKNTNVRLAATVVFVEKDQPNPDKDLLQVLGIPDIAKADEKPKKVAESIAVEDRRRVLAATLKKEFAGSFTELNPFTKQNLVVVCIASDADLKNYGLDPNRKTTVVLYNKLEIRAVHAYEDLDDAKIDAIMKDVADKLGATKK